MSVRVRCRDLREQAASLVAGEVPAAASAAFEAHASACPACAETLARERSLQALLGALPDAPEAVLDVPPLPQRGRLVRARFLWAAGAAAGALAAWAFLERPIAREVPDVGKLRVVDAEDGGSIAWDDGLLRLVAGAEAVASRRLVETR